MLTKLTIRNFKRFATAEIELGNPVVFIGPNNSGKTTALQAIALWDVGLRRWNEKRGGKETAVKRPGVAINRKDLIAVPIPDANLLWKDLHVRDVRRVNGKPDTRHVFVDIVVEGVTKNTRWICGLEFDYANDESLYCRPLRKSPDKRPERMLVPEDACATRVAFLPPMSGLADREFAKQPGEIGFLIGQGRTAEVLRNLCLQVLSEPDGSAKWRAVVARVKDLFGIVLNPPEYSEDRSEITMTYRESSEAPLDLSSAGRGVHQTLLLLAYLSVNPQSVLLLDEPDAHLEILRQRQIYNVLTDAAREQESQIVIASHSEVILNEAAARDVVVAFVGQPHRLNDRPNQLLKALKDIGFEDYYQAEQRGWVLYLEGSTDLAILRAFAAKLQHGAKNDLESPFVHYVENQPSRARDHFYGLLGAKPDLVGFLLNDRMERAPQSAGALTETMWTRREIENYLCQPETLLAWAEASAEETSPGPLFTPGQAAGRRELMDESIRELVPPVALRNADDVWWRNVKASDEFLDRLFEIFFEKLHLPNLIRKTNYHLLDRHVPVGIIDPEIAQKLDLIHAVAEGATPR
ncbi:MAG TPA: AAA family ATPase [Bryobacteraceae bacterium]|nr:AAA family ATPase [Bryobacteraceae bacterium]